MEVHIIWLAIFLTAVLCRSYCLCDANQMKLELVQVLFRHGERTPAVEEYAAFHYTDLAAYEPFGLEQLTDNGKNQAYKVGLMLRQRYKGFLSDNYNRKDIFAQSAELDRMQTSLQLVLAGLYSSQAESDFNPNWKWNPIPYRYAPEKFDVLFRQFKSKKYQQLLNDVMKSSVVKKKFDAYLDLLEFFKDKEGVTVNTCVDLYLVSVAMSINTRMNISQPTWYSDKLMSRLTEFVILYANCMSFTPEMRRVMSGPLVKTFLERMNFNETTYNPRKMYLYSGCDFNVAAVARALNVDGFGFVDFSNTLILEKLRDSHGQLFVRILEWDAINEKLNHRKMKECAELCPVDDFLRICRDLIPSHKEMHYLLDDYQGQDILDLYLKDPLIEAN